MSPARAEARFDRDGVFALECSGASDLRTGVPTDEHTRMRWYSVTKLVTATAVMQLVERGRLSLEHPVREAGGATVRELLAHASGLPDPCALGWVHPPGAPRRSASELTRALLDRHAPRRRPGRVVYTNLGYLALAERVAEVTGRPFGEHVRAVILEPAGMGRASFDASGAAVGHERALRAAAMAGIFFPRSRRMIRYVQGGWVGLAPFELEGEGYGGLLGSISDLVRFGRLHLGDGAIDGVRLLDAATARRMRAAENASFGLGFERYRDGWVGHDGQAGGYRASLRLHPASGVGVATLAAWGDAPTPQGLGSS